MSIFSCSCLSLSLTPFPKLFFLRYVHNNYEGIGSVLDLVVKHVFGNAQMLKKPTKREVYLKQKNFRTVFEQMWSASALQCGNCSCCLWHINWLFFMVMLLFSFSPNLNFSYLEDDSIYFFKLSPQVFRIFLEITFQSIQIFFYKFPPQV